MCNSISSKPCNNCPYRKDAPLRHWDVSEFIRLLQEDVKDANTENLGSSFGCHKKNGKNCTGWLVTQLKSNNPSIMARVAELKLRIQGSDKDLKKAMSSELNLYDSLQEMVIANYPELKDKINSLCQK
jgi:hypothetical protein